tara:strand:- start:19 stop:381 length:363 start_codon:yes stop_codon:yes gene_type:complete
MSIKDVKEILDIPDIEKYLNCIFTFDLYEPGDKDIHYSYWLDDSVCVQINFMLDKHPFLIEGHKKLSDLIMMEGIGYFQMSIGIVKQEWCSEYGCYMTTQSDLFQQHHYRPHCEEEKKQY